MLEIHLKNAVTYKSKFDLSWTNVCTMYSTTHFSCIFTMVLGPIIFKLCKVTPNKHFEWKNTVIVVP